MQFRPSYKSAVIRRYANRFYLKYIRPADPGFFLVRYAGKAVFSCLVSFLAALLLGLASDALFWWMAGAVITVLFRTGSTLKRRKIYALGLLAIAAVTVPVATVAGQATYLSLGFIFLLAFACFFVASAGLSASTIGNGCLIVTLISIFSPAGPDQGILRSVSLLSGGMVSFFTNFYLWPFDPEKALLASARLAIEDMGFYLEHACLRVGNPRATDDQGMRQTAIASVRRYRTFLESFNIDPLKGRGVSGGPGLFYFALIRMYESIVGLSNHTHFADNRPEFRQLKKDFHLTATGISDAFNRFSGPDRAGGTRSHIDFHDMNRGIDRLRESLLTMGGYRQGDAVQEKFLDAWAAVYELKNVTTEFQEMQHLAKDKFRLRRS